MKVEATCTAPHTDCPTVIDLGNGEVFRHVQLVEATRIRKATPEGVLGQSEALDDEGNLIECAYCGSLLIVQQMTTPDALFALGRVAFTPGVMRLFGMAPDERTAERQETMYSTTSRWLTEHKRGEFGSLAAEDASANRQAMRVGSNGQAEGRIMSVWWFNQKKVWIITERGRHATTVLLPEEY